MYALLLFLSIAFHTDAWYCIFHCVTKQIQDQQDISSHIETSLSARSSQAFLFRYTIPQSPEGAWVFSAICFTIAGIWNGLRVAQTILDSDVQYGRFPIHNRSPIIAPYILNSDFGELLGGFRWATKNRNDELLCISKKCIVRSVCDSINLWAWQSFICSQLWCPKLGIAWSIRIHEIHPRKLTWIPKMMVWKRQLPLKIAILGIYVRFLECKSFSFSFPTKYVISKSLKISHWLSKCQWRQTKLI